MDKYTVWVGGSEINTTYLNYDDAVELAKEYIAGGYEDVTIEQVA